MSIPRPAEDRCGNEGCPRTAEPGEAYCFSCGLERSLYERDTRRPAADASARASEGERGR